MKKTLWIGICYNHKPITREIQLDLSVKEKEVVTIGDGSESDYDLIGVIIKRIAEKRIINGLSRTKLK